MTNDLTINGSQGEGGGQIVRSSLALALVTGRAVTIEKIRAGRERPGLMRQHLTAVRAAAEVCGGAVEGAEIGSQALRLVPGKVQPGKYQFSVGTAGSATLVLQTVLPALLIADGPSELILEGGTHNQWAPPFDFLQRAFLPLVNQMGPQVTANIERHGFYPAGGGRFVVSIEPAPQLAGFDLLERGEIKSRSCRALVSNLPQHVGQREVERVLSKLTWNEACGSTARVEAHGPGNVVMVELVSEYVTEVFTGFGRTGIKAEEIADEAVRQARDYLRTDVPVGPYLADQLLLPLGISAWQAAGTPRRAFPTAPDAPQVGTPQRAFPTGGAFRTLPLTRHSTTHIEILRQFLGCKIDCQRSEDGATCLVRVGAGGAP